MRIRRLSSGWRAMLARHRVSSRSSGRSSPSTIGKGRVCYRRVLVSAAVATAVGWSGAAVVPASAARPAAVITLGIHDGAINNCDQDGAQTTPPTAAELAAAISSFTSRFWPAVRVLTVRFSPPWDIAYHHDGGPNSTANKELAATQACFNAWLVGAQRVGARPEIAFKPDHNFRTRDGRFVKAPDIHTYRLAINAFTSQYSNPVSTNGMARVRIIAPWGEPDDPAGIVMPAGGHKLSDPSCHGSPRVNTCGPILAAHMWQAVRASCMQCSLLGKGPGSGVIAGDFSSLGGIRGKEAGPGGGLRDSYLDVYRQNLAGHRPVVWALHPYSDIMAFERPAPPTSRPRPAPARSSASSRSTCKRSAITSTPKYGSTRSAPFSSTTKAAPPGHGGPRQCKPQPGPTCSPSCPRQPAARPNPQSPAPTT